MCLHAHVAFDNLESTTGNQTTTQISLKSRMFTQHTYMYLFTYFIQIYHFPLKKIHISILYIFLTGENDGIINRIREEVTRKCRRIYNLFLNCLGHLP